MYRNLFLVLTLFILFSNVQAQVSGSLKQSFGNGGKLLSGVFSYTEGKAMARQADGKIVVCATANINGSKYKQIVVARFDSNGKLDATFANNGYQIIPISNQTADAEASDVVIDGNGKIIVCGNYNVTPVSGMVSRLLTTGQFDLSFGTAATYNSKNFYIKANCITKNNGIALCGYYQGKFGDDTAMVQVLKASNGTRDSTFGVNGEYRSRASATSKSHFNDVIAVLPVSGQPTAVVAVGSRTKTNNKVLTLIDRINLSSSPNAQSVEFQASSSLDSKDTATHVTSYQSVLVVGGNKNDISSFSGYLMFVSPNSLSLSTGYGSNGIISLQPSTGSEKLNIKSLIPSAKNAGQILVTGNRSSSQFLFSVNAISGARTNISLPSNFEEKFGNNFLVDILVNDDADSFNPDIFLLGSLVQRPSPVFAKLRLFRVYENGNTYTSGFGNSGVVDTVFGHYNSEIQKLIYNENATGTSKQLITVGSFTNAFGGCGLASYTLSDGLLNKNFGLAGRSGLEATNGVNVKSAVSTSLTSSGLFIAANSTITPLNTFVARYNANLINDNFTTSTLRNWGISKATNNAIAYDSASNTLLIAGDTGTSAKRNIFFARYQVNPAQLDYSFSFDGLQLAPVGTQGSVNALALSKQSKKPIAAGHFDNDNTGIVMLRKAVLIKLNADGSLDNLFSGDGVAYSSISGEESVFNALAEQGDEKIVAVGYVVNGSNKANILISRFDKLGELDNSFGNGGELEIDFANRTDIATDVKILHDNRIVVGGYFNNGSNNDFFVMVLNPDGTSDASFGNNGNVFIDFGSSSDNANCLLLPDTNTILIGGKGGAAQVSAIASLAYQSAGVYSSINEIEGSDISLYPNPTSGFLNITSSIGNGFNLSVYSMEGRLLLEHKSLINNERIDVSHLAQGVYSAVIDLRGRLQHSKFIVTY